MISTRLFNKPNTGPYPGFYFNRGKNPPLRRQPPKAMTPSPSPFRLPPFPSFHSLPLEVPVKYNWRVWGSAVSSPSGVWGGAPAEIEFGAF